jgi:hypothetical protein
MPRIPGGNGPVWEQLKKVFGAPDLRLSAISAVLAKCLVFIGRLLVLARLWRNFTEKNENFAHLTSVRRLKRL